MSKKMDFSQSVYEHINRNNLQIKPKFWFVLGNILLGVGAIGAILVGIFVFNLVVAYFDSLNRQDCLCWQVIANDFPYNLPIIPIVLAVICLIAGILLLRQFRVVYSRSLWLVLGIILPISVILVVALTLSGLNEKLMVTPMSRTLCAIGMCPYDVEYHGRCPNASEHAPTCG